MIYLDASALITLVTGHSCALELREFLGRSPEMCGGDAQQDRH